MTAVTSPAAAYAAAGLEVFPLPVGQKSPPPPRVTGADGAPYRGDWPTGANVGLRMPAWAVGLDIDGAAHDGKRGPETIAALEAQLGPLPATAYSTRHGAGSDTRIAVFEIPEGTRLSEAGLGDVEIVQRHHRYAVVAPSALTDGSAYRWYDAEDAPLLVPGRADIETLPDAWVAHLTAPPLTDSLDTDVAAWVAENDGQPSGDLRAALDALPPHGAPEWSDANLCRLARPLVDAAGYAYGGAVARDEFADRYASGQWATVEHRTAALRAFDTVVRKHGEPRINPDLVERIDAIFADAFVSEPVIEAADPREQRIAQEVERIEIAEEARRRHAANGAASLVLPQLLSGDDLLEADFGEEETVITGFLEAGGNTLVTAQRKAGKSTLMLNAIRSLVDGDPFLDEFQVRKRRRVAYLDLELSDKRAQTWAGLQHIEHGADWSRIALRGRSATFDIRDDRTRARWADLLAGFDVLILDPLRPLADALGLDESHDLGVIFQAFDALKHEAGISEGIVVHHMGWDDSHGRGDSRQEDWPDTIVRLRTSDPDDPGALRFLSSFGRGDVDITEGLVSKYDGTRLTYARASRTEAKRDAVLDAVVAFVTEHPGAKVRDLESAGIKGVTKNTVAGVIANAEKAGLIRVETGERNAKHLHPVIT